MKFKIIFLLFNILVIFSFLMIFLMPVFMLGGDYAMDFFRDSWYIAIVFVVIIVFINVLYFRNRRMLSLLETENWNGLMEMLEEKIFTGNKTGKTNIKMYISTCVAMSKIEDLGALERKLRTDNPKAMKEWALQLGIPYLAKNDPAAMKKYFGEFIDADTDDAGWIKWNYCFALLLLKESDEALEILKPLSAERKDPVLRLLTLYMLSPFSNDETAGKLLEEGKKELRSRMTRRLFEKEVEKKNDNAQMLFITKILGEAMEWLFQGE